MAILFPNKLFKGFHKALSTSGEGAADEGHEAGLSSGVSRYL